MDDRVVIRRAQELMAERGGGMIRREDVRQAEAELAVRLKLDRKGRR